MESIWCGCSNFYPRSPRGERHEYRRCCRQRYNFYPRSPRGERHRSGPGPPPGRYYFYPRSPRGERPHRRSPHRSRQPISIHAPREGSDYSIRKNKLVTKIISIHAPREGSDLDVVRAGGPDDGFLSTLPARGATSPPSFCGTGQGHFYPRSPRGERRRLYRRPRQRPNFYPRSPRGERPAPARASRPHQVFLSTLPARGATSKIHKQGLEAIISIHAPREGSDTQAGGQCGADGHFYPRSPRGERPLGISISRSTRKFLSTLPARGATSRRRKLELSSGFLSTLPARGATATDAEDLPF